VRAPGAQQFGRPQPGEVVRKTKHVDLPLPVFVGQTAGYLGASDQFDWGDTLAVTPWVLASRYGTCQLDTLSFFCRDPQGGQVRLSLWTDDGGTPPNSKPGTLIAETAAHTLTQGWNHVPPITRPFIAPQRLWIGVNLSSDSIRFQARLGSERGNSVRYVAHSFGAAPGTWPGGDTRIADQNWCAYATLSSQTRTRPPDPPAPQMPPAIAGLGYHLVFQDEFDWFDRRHWTNQVHWDGCAQEDAQFCENSILKLVSRQTDGYDHAGGNYYVNGWPNNYIDTLGVPGLDTLRYGYYECRMRSTDPNASYPACRLIESDWEKSEGDVGTCPTPELDVVELWGNDWPNAYSGTVHSNTAGGESGSPGPCSGSGFNVQSPDSFNGDVGFPTIGQWHTYAALWEPDHCTWYVNDVEMYDLAIGAGTDWASFDGANMHVICYIWPWQGGELSGPPTPGVTAAEVVSEFDWVRVWQL